jgi:rod shape-determining protein MreD
MFKKIKLRLLLLVCLTIIIQVSVVPFLHINRIAPDLVFVVFMLLAMTLSRRYTLFLALLFGFIKELFASHYFGNELIPYLIIGLLLPAVINRFNCENKMIRFIIIFCFSFLVGAVNILCIALSEYSSVILENFFQKTIYVSIYTTIVAFFVSPLVALIVPKKSIQYELF